jgi:hypothetical protein
MHNPQQLPTYLLLLLCLGCMQPSVEAAVAANPSRFVVADVKWTGGTEQMLDAVQHFLAEAGVCEAVEQQKQSLVTA